MNAKAQYREGDLRRSWRAWNDEHRIAQTSPHGDLFSFDLVAREFTDYGKLTDEEWVQHRSVAMDDSGWIYSTIVFQRGNIVGYFPGGWKPNLEFPDGPLP